MNETTFDLYNDGYHGTDASTGSIPEEPSFPGTDADTGFSGDSDIPADDTDVISGTGTGNGDSSGNDAGNTLDESGEGTGEENENVPDQETDGETGGDSEDETLGETDSGTDGEPGEISGTDIPEAFVFDTEVFEEIRDILAGHADQTDAFMSGLTVSGNVITVTPDDGTSALLHQYTENQSALLDSIDGMSSTLALVLFVLLFDMVHRFAKRIVKNFSGGGNNAANS